MSELVFIQRKPNYPDDELLYCPQLYNYSNVKAVNTKWAGAPTPYNNYPASTKLSTGERRCLYMMGYIGGNVVELGTHLGGGAATLGWGMKDGGKGGSLFVVDNFGEPIDGDGHVNIGEYGAVDRLSAYFKSNIPDIKLNICKGDTSSWAKRIPVSSVDLVFIDADHTYKGCKKDYDAWSPLIRKGGLLIFHDCHLIGVNKVIDEMKGFTLEEHVWSMKVFRCTR